MYSKIGYTVYHTIPQRSNSKCIVHEIPCDNYGIINENRS